MIFGFVYWHARFPSKWNHSDFWFSYIVKRGSPGLTVRTIENKIGLRILQNGDIHLKKVFVPDEDRLPGINSFKDLNKVGRCKIP